MLAAEELIHVVGKGETIYSISRFYRVTPDELMKLNSISDPSKLQTGKRLTIPSSAFSDITITTNPPAPAVQALTDYRVLKGDTLFSIAKKHDISLQRLQEINNFSSSHVIKVGDIVKVPGQPKSNTAQSAPAPGKSTGTTGLPGILALRWPVNAKEISYMTGQMGVVVEGEINEAVKSLTQGKVISAGPWRKFGKVAIVEVAGGYFYMYGGCDTLSVNVGDKISPGTELGKLGVNAVSEKPQLFFMVFRSDIPIDPAKAPRAGGNSRT
ncbi:MAG: M23 family metallopeptidase [Treponema sp.]|nr:M23 family metallopeptidase [Treponema sp.]